MLSFGSKVTLDGYNLILLEGTLEKKGVDLERGIDSQIQIQNLRKLLLYCHLCLVLQFKVNVGIFVAVP